MASKSVEHRASKANPQADKAYAAMQAKVAGAKAAAKAEAKKK